MFVGVSVFVPATLNVGEGDGMVQVCAELFAMDSTEIDFGIALTTHDGSG